MDPDAIEEGFSPAFVNVDHELEFPEGIEGPIPIYVEAPNANNVNQSITTKVEDDQQTVDNKGDSLSYYGKCPRCEEKVPSDLKELFCSSKSVVKVAIRRSRKVRLLLDLKTSELLDKRLRSTIELSLEPKCSCALLDKRKTFCK